MPEEEKITSFVQAAQTGDERAFAELVRAFQDIAVGYATSILGDYHLAEDAAQEAFVEAYRDLPNLREPAAFAAWFRLILFKHCDRLTWRKRPLLTGLEAALEIAAPVPSPQETLETHEAQQSIREAIAALSDTEPQVVLLYYMGEHSTAAIAAFLEITTNAVKTRLYAARKRLRNQMGDIEENLNAVRPSSDPKFAEKVQRMIRPEALKKTERLFWSPGIGADVWEMFCACITGDLETVKRLVKKDASLARCHYEYRTPLSFAARQNQVEIAAFLLDHGAEPFGVGGDLIQVAQERGYAEMEKLLTGRYADIFGASTRGDAVAAAIRERDPEKMRRLLDESPDLLNAGDKFSNQPIHWAVMSRQPGLIDELLARGADINARRGDGARPLHLINGDYHYRGWRDVPQWTSGWLRRKEIWRAFGNCWNKTQRWLIASLITILITSAAEPRSKTPPSAETSKSSNFCWITAPIQICRKKALRRAAMRCTQRFAAVISKLSNCCWNTAPSPMWRSKALPTR